MAVLMTTNTMFITLNLNNCHLWLTVVPALPFSPYQQACSSNIVDSWEQLWKDPKCVEKSETNAKNRRGGRSGVSTETHTGGSVSIGEYRKRLVSISQP
uniref:Uncharacterized protein LOC104231918 isoform X2 n=1 Tax=Nicotiana sylvestris TaxID=4096 RepID=A0A1U7WTP5_NICSY|nr:PREDICTED: uncharacterized protein LOC104231918 isoform X2 [Nicotiana sylvestris]